MILLQAVLNTVLKINFFLSFGQRGREAVVSFDHQNNCPRKFLKSVNPSRNRSGNKSTTDCHPRTVWLSYQITSSPAIPMVKHKHTLADILGLCESEPTVLKQYVQVHRMELTFEFLRGNILSWRLKFVFPPFHLHGLSLGHFTFPQPIRPTKGREGRGKTEQFFFLPISTSVPR